jgi:hypothetical protein
MMADRICAQCGREVEGFETPEECRSHGLNLQEQFDQAYATLWQRARNTLHAFVLVIANDDTRGQRLWLTEDVKEVLLMKVWLRAFAELGPDPPPLIDNRIGPNFGKPIDDNLPRCEKCGHAVYPYEQGARIADGYWHDDCANAPTD